MLILIFRLLSKAAYRWSSIQSKHAVVEGPAVRQVPRYNNINMWNSWQHDRGRGLFTYLQLCDTDVMLVVLFMLTARIALKSRVCGNTVSDSKWVYSWVYEGEDSMTQRHQSVFHTNSNCGLTLSLQHDAFLLENFTTQQSMNVSAF